MRKLLEGKTAIVTGASKGIGYAIAELFSEEGANVVITARKQDELDKAVGAIRKNGGKAVAVVADNADRDAPARVFKEAIDAFGQVDILVNNAGVGEMYAVEKTSDDHFDKIVQINLAGPFRFCREAVNHMMPRNEGRIINVSSVNGTTPICGVAYTSTKGGLNTMTLNIAMRLSGTKIRCNAIAPGVTDTDAARAWAAGEQEGGGEMLEFSDKYTNTSVPSTEPIDQAYAALYLASEMGRAVTGQVIQVDNGQFI
ncbi:SDR family NAD(P)-dependent oxidoreductase [Allosediminivita pacifica]|uniref:NAD(P)-dependent dehydrogenase (Short-subunit alcohol dehydrogenase family) n=1 Tax=Allosediminivita pacifica TaxID=1267769 RepID=A0A2T6B7V9_9RHOB|nr:SDR family oxidoreductase [Allosediminivita pacifica]PTX52171.1 NAD(P)-dependent dehydrogenase (short-subunit alcohol dehydrogenase family) [Allosediminivita pacifica]GGA96569.1 beta-ketoacyl-ACP reductase [Allosediminivita pacifica]